MQETFYNAARDAINNRIRLRDNVLIFYLAAIAAIFGAAFGTKTNTDLLLMVPFVALGASFMLTQHHTTIGSIVRYLAFELESSQNKTTNSVHWDISKSATNNNQRSMFLIVWSHLALIIFPAFSALLYKVSDIRKIDKGNLLFFAFLFGCLAVIWSFILILNAHSYRTKINTEIRNISNSV